MTSFEYLRLQTRALTHYLRLVLWPHPLRAVYDWSVPGPELWVPLGLVVVGLLAASVWAVRTGRPWAGYLGAWFFLILAPTSSCCRCTRSPWPSGACTCRSSPCWRCWWWPRAACSYACCRTPGRACARAPRPRRSWRRRASR